LAAGNKGCEGKKEGIAFFHVRVYRSLNILKAFRSKSIREACF
jgi:hypothetical protein